MCHNAAARGLLRQSLSPCQFERSEAASAPVSARESDSWICVQWRKGWSRKSRTNPEKINSCSIEIDSARLPAQSAQILVAFRDALERILGPVMLDDIVLDPGLVGLSEDLLPVDDAVTNGGQVCMIAEVLATAS